MAAAFQTNAFQNNAFQTVAVEIPVEPPFVSGPPAPSRQIPFEIIDVRVSGQILVIHWSLISGTAIGTGKAFGESVLVVNALAGGVSLDVQQWQLLGGTARSKITLTDDEELILMLAEAA